MAAKADVTVRDKNGQTALSLARERARMEKGEAAKAYDLLAKYLLQHGAQE